jgi:hypothetical protein
MWFDGADATTYNPTNITSWANKGIGGGTATINSNKPTMSNINGRPTMTFSGTTGMGISLTFASGVRSFFVVSFPGPNTSSYAYVNQQGASAIQFNAWSVSNFGPFLGANGVGIYGASSSAANFYNIPNIFCALGNGSTGQTTSTGIFMTGISTPLSGFTNAANLLTGTITTNIGGDPTIPSYAGIPIGEIIVFDALLTIVQRQQIEGYLAWKWGLAKNLPVSHPYKTFPP